MVPPHKTGLPSFGGKGNRGVAFFVTSHALPEVHETKQSTQGPPSVTSVWQRLQRLQRLNAGRSADGVAMGDPVRSLVICSKESLPGPSKERRFVAYSPLAVKGVSINHPFVTPIREKWNKLWGSGSLGLLSTPQRRRRSRRPSCSAPPAWPSPWRPKEMRTGTNEAA